jgi:hypothetical protein
MGTVPPPPEQQPPETVVPAQPATEELAAEENGTPGAAADATTREAPPVEEATPDASDAPPEPAGRRRGRLPLLLASAALLGIVAGVATGYTVQADRKPTALPPLSQHTLAYPKKRLSADEVTPLPAKYDHRVKTDGDLRKLLLPKPKGAQKADLLHPQGGWLSIADYAQHFMSPGEMFRTLSTEDVRRIASRSWQLHGRDVSVDLVQFQDFGQREADSFTDDQQRYMPGDEWAGYRGKALPGSGNGRYWGGRKADREPGYLPEYTARALAYRGDIVMDIQIYDTHPISEKIIRALAEKQLECL